MKNYTKFIIMLFFSLMNLFVSAQIRLDYYISGGTSRYVKFIRDIVDLNLGNTYDFSYSLANGINFSYNLPIWGLNIKSGINLNYYTCRMGVTDEFYQEIITQNPNAGPQYWTIYLFTGSSSLYLGYNLSDKLNIFGGINNNLKISESNIEIWTSHRYFYTIDLGTEVYLGKRIRIFAIYQNSFFKPPFTMKQTSFKRQDLRLENINVGVEYSFLNSKK